MLEPPFTIRDDFPPMSYQQWQAEARSALKSNSLDDLVTHTYEQIDLQPLYVRSDRADVPDASRYFPLAKQRMDLRQLHQHPDLVTSHDAVLADLAGGATSVHLELSNIARRGLDPDDARADSPSPRGLPVYHVDDLEALLRAVELSELGVSLDAGSAFLPAAAMLIALWQRRGVTLATARGAFNADPLGELARSPSFPSLPSLPARCETQLSWMANLAAWTAEHCTRCTSVCVDTAPYHEAGATETQDLACGLATAVEYLRTLCGAGMETNAAANQFQFRMCLGTDYFLAIAKLRAARLLWARVMEVCGGEATECPLQIHARISRRVLTRRDPHTNLLRNTAALFAATVGGADMVTSLPLDHVVGLPDEFSRRIARNTVSILREEGQLDRVADAARGSWFLERYTEQIAEHAWSIFQQIERQGGMLAAVRSGWIVGQVEASFAAMSQDVADNKRTIVGVTQFINDEAPQQFADRFVDIAALHQAAAERIKQQRREQDQCLIRSAGVAQIDSCVEAAARRCSLGQLAAGLGFDDDPEESISLLPVRRFAEPYELA